MLPDPIKRFAFLFLQQEVTDCREEWHIENVSFFLPLNPNNTLQKSL
jgi:hypothetical protein